MRRSATASMTARESGCSLFASRLAATFNNFSSLSSAYMSVTRGFPSVSVPVLSSTTTSVFPHASRAAAVLNKIPCFAPSPLPTMIATGVARPNAQGQLMTSTLTARARAKPASAPAASHTIPVPTAKTMTAGTKMPDTLSASFAAGAFVAAAFSTISIILLKEVSLPTRVARHVRNPF